MVRWRRSTTSWGLRAQLLVPLIAIVVATAGVVGWLNWQADRDQADLTAGRQAASELGGIVERVTELQQNTAAYAQLLGADDRLAKSVLARDEVGVAQALLPLKRKLGLYYYFVFDDHRNPLLRIGRQDVVPDALGLVGETRTALTVSKVVVTPDGLAALAATPLRDENHQDSFGTLVVGSVLSEDSLKKVKARTKVDLVIVRDGRVVGSTLEDAALNQALDEADVTGDDLSHLNRQLLAARHLRATVRVLTPGSVLVALVSTEQVEAASEQRTLVALAGLGAMLLALLLVSVLLAQRVVRSLHALVASTKQMAHGNYSLKLPGTRIRELDELTASINEMGEQLEEQVGELTHQAFHDSLSGLANRALFLDRLNHAMARARRRHYLIAVLLIDLDNFKVVNDSLGHHVGDGLLIGVAKRLQTLVRPEDTVARFGGDEFTILLEGLTEVSQAAVIGERIVERLGLPFVIGDQHVFTGGSIGIVVREPRDGDAERMVADADLAMYRAKAQGKGRWVLFEHAMSESAVRRGELEMDLRSAVERGELRLHYQPVVRLSDGRLGEVEALLRWQHPRLGLLPPSEFISIAEETGIIVAIGMWVFAEACRQVRLWQIAYPSDPPLVVSVNLSTRQFQQPALVEDISRILRQTQLPPECLKLEVTEGTMMQDTEAAIRQLCSLKELGVKLAIDDFGTGYSSLSYLKTLPIDTIKIDRSFVSGIGCDPEDTAIVQAIVGLAKSLNLEVTGEGLETLDQIQHLQSLDCETGQGFYYARPLSPESMADLLASAPTGPLPLSAAPEGMELPSARAS